MPDAPAPDSISHSDLLPRLLTLPRGATVLMLGGTDTGKTTCVREMAQAASAAGKAVAVLSCDLGQGEIGPPGTIGGVLISPEAAWLPLRELPPLASYFVGAVSPARCSLEICIGAVQAVRVLKKNRPDLILVDTDGFVSGSAARFYKQHLVDLLLPQVIVVSARADELDPILRGFTHRKTPAAWHVPVSEAVQRKSPAVRAARRAARFLAAFEGSQSLTFSLDEVALLGTGLGIGSALPVHLQQFLSQSLRRPVLHAEKTTQGLYIVTHGEGLDLSGLAAVESYFGTRSLTIVAAQKFAQLFVGLLSSSQELLGIGRIERIDFARRTLNILSPCRKPRAVVQIRFGRLRVKADGRELGEVKPGEI